MYCLNHTGFYKLALMLSTSLFAKATLYLIALLQLNT